MLNKLVLMCIATAAAGCGADSSDVSVSSAAPIQPGTAAGPPNAGSAPAHSHSQTDQEIADLIYSGSNREVVLWTYAVDSVTGAITRIIAKLLTLHARESDGDATFCEAP